LEKGTICKFYRYKYECECSEQMIPSKIPLVSCPQGATEPQGDPKTAQEAVQEIGKFVSVVVSRGFISHFRFSVSFLISK